MSDPIEFVSGRDFLMFWLTVVAVLGFSVGMALGCAWGML